MAPPHPLRYLTSCSRLFENGASVRGGRPQGGSRDGGGDRGFWFMPQPRGGGVLLRWAVGGERRDGLNWREARLGGCLSNTGGRAQVQMAKTEKIISCWCSIRALDFFNESKDSPPGPLAIGSRRLVNVFRSRQCSASTSINVRPVGGVETCETGLHESRMWRFAEASCIVYPPNESTPTHCCTHLPTTTCLCCSRTLISRLF
ncbi:hypothetical protein BS50DRAFT_369899 [Corynespora cassiicola Philippines]|uniref:Uncharacterized protein n=1 Tax=Corynespora cassiicola Philippines TaxID=1448308 RepID=A0A2T2NMW1_CORCC|nr:hypothetical protein BS50DRAFT_369899 [Corynespora cassiicola Philippines]